MTGDAFVVIRIDLSWSDAETGILDLHLSSLCVETTIWQAGTFKPCSNWARRYICDRI